MKPITWKTEIRKLGDLFGWKDNPRFIDKPDQERLQESFAKFGYSQLIEIEPDNTILDGHQRDSLMLIMDRFGPHCEIEVRVASRKFTVDERKEYIAIKHKGATGQFDWDKMHVLFADPNELVKFGFTVNELIAQGYVFLGDEDLDFSNLDDENENLDGYQDVEIKIVVAEIYRDQVIDYLANGEAKTAPGMGKGVLKLCGLL